MFLDSFGRYSDFLPCLDSFDHYSDFDDSYLDSLGRYLDFDDWYLDGRRLGDEGDSLIGESRPWRGSNSATRRLLRNLAPSARRSPNSGRCRDFDDRYLDISDVFNFDLCQYEVPGAVARPG